MLRISHLTLARGSRRLLHDASLTVHARQKVGMVGANGTGKSSLFALIRGELLPEAGSVELPASWIVAHVAQETPAGERPAIEFVLDGDRELRDIERELRVAEAQSSEHDEAAGHRLAELHHRFEAIGGYAARARAAMLLDGLGFAADAHGNAVSAFSGGWRMRLNLAQALMCRSDLLLLDEPTNHLDLDAVMWLEDWLARYPGTLLLITHDRDFLDAVVDAIVHVTQGELRTYTGNYSSFERERASQLALQQATYAKQQRQIAHLQAFVDRFRAKATKARQAQSRIKALERMERIAAAHVDSPFEFSFAPVAAHARQLVRLEHATLSYGVSMSDDHDPDGAQDSRAAAATQPVLAGVDWSILSGDRIGLLGPNGAGKSTLLKAIAGVLPLASGTRHQAQNLNIGYFAQHQLDQLRPDESPLWHLQRLEPASREQDLRDFLGGFDFRGDMAATPVRTFSGGEKARLTLALLVRQKPDLLLLDEPTNHLDIEMREALTEALQDYDGALVVVAHDRHLLRATADALWLVAHGAVTPFDGDLDDYREWVLDRRRRTIDAESPASAMEPTQDRKAQRRADAQARQQRYARRKPLAEQLARVEKSMAALSGEKAELETWLASEEAYRAEHRELLTTRIARQGALAAELERLEHEWLELSEALEALED